VTSIARLWQYGQIGPGGWSSAPHAVHRWNRSSPSAPAVQKNSFSGVSCGSGRLTRSATMVSSMLVSDGTGAAS
jgi:hypothetical protein